MNKEIRPFEEYKEMIQNMSKDDMIKGLYDLSANIIEKSNEIERLNNIINELEKYLKEENKFDEYKDITYRETTGCVLNKLKELKENS